MQAISQTWTDAILDSNMSFSENLDISVVDKDTPIISNTLTINAVMIMISEGPDSVMLQRQAIPDVLVSVVGMAIKNLLSPNVFQDNGFFVSFAH
jgi:hypothetical protein